jgi:hypothetical protein
MPNKRFTLLALAAATLACFATQAAAENRPIQLALVTPVQLFSEDDAVTGLRFNFLYGRNVFFTGLDLGLVNHTTEGISKGLQYGLVGLADEDFMGWQDNMVNVVNGNFEGFQSALVDYAYSANGLQLAIVNYAGSMKGLQIGLVNIIREGGAFPVFPIVNWSF